jgi:DNA polymerase I
MMAKKVKLAIVDAHALIHRAYHALPPMSTKDGVPTNAVYGFTSMFLKMLATLKPTHVVVAFDMKGPTFRHKEFKEYKAHRKVAPDDLIEQFDLVREVVRSFNIPVIEKQGFEADDIVGTLVKRIDGGVKKIVVTGDLDTLQLVDDFTSIFTLKRGVSDTILYTEEKVLERYGFVPELVPDYKGLRGDPSDNIPGVQGVGEKTAKDLVAQFGSIENIYEHMEELPTRAQTRLKGHKKEALFSRKLATIKLDAKIQFKLEEALLPDYDVEEVLKVFNKLELKSLIQRVPKSNRGAQMTLLGGAGESEKKVKLPKHYQLVETPDEQKKLRALLEKQEIIAFDTETDWLGARQYPIVGMSFSFGSGKKLKAWYVPVDPETVLAWKGLLENKKVKKTGHNIKYDMEVLAQSGIQLKPVAFDSMIASYLLNPGGRQHSLDALAVQELAHYPIPISALIGSGKNQKKVSEVPLHELARYACEDAELTWRLYEVLRPHIKKEGLEQVLTELELPLISVLSDMELTGVALDKKVLKGLQKRVSRRLGGLRKKIWQEAGGEFNINSTQQLREILFNELKLSTEGISRTQTGFSTAAAELDKLRGEHVVIEYLEEYRELSKLLNTYIETLPKLADKKTGRIYASFNQTVTATGRLSSSDPNLQNIPAKTDLGQEVRAAFVAERGKRLIKADYSQIELRLAAHMSQDEKMLEAFRAGKDIHQSTAAWVNGIELDEVTKKQRREAKTLNFGVLYGMGSRNFAREAGVSMEEARSFIGRYHEQYNGLTKFMEKIAEQARGLGYVETLFGRKRFVPEINSRAPNVRAQAERAAINFPLQGTAADMLKKAMIVLHERINKEFSEVKMVLTVHDELVCEVPSGQVKKFARVLREIMENVFTLDVPLTVDVMVGKNWRDMEAF